jgi:hypothetical protein
VIDASPAAAAPPGVVSVVAELRGHAQRARRRDHHPLRTNATSRAVLISSSIALQSSFSREEEPCDGGRGRESN